MLTALKAAGMTDDQIAIETHVSQPTITRLRNGTHKEPRHRTWAAISEAYLKVEAERVVRRRA